MTTYMGTNRFRTHRDAVLYYRKLGLDVPDVNRKLRDGEIVIGSPSHNGKVRIDEDGRYHVELIEDHSHRGLRNE